MIGAARGGCSAGWRLGACCLSAAGRKLYGASRALVPPAYRARIRLVPHSAYVPIALEFVHDRESRLANRAQITSDGGGSTVKIVGFLGLFVTDVDQSGNVNPADAVIPNAALCNGTVVTNPGATIPVRLIHS